MDGNDGVYALVHAKRRWLFDATLAAADYTGPKTSEGDALAAGAPIGLEREGVGSVTEPVGPPVVWEANGAGTRSAIPSTRNKPGLR